MSNKITLFFFAAFFCSVAVSAQSADSVYNKYLDFNMAKFQGDHDKIMELGEDLLPFADKLPEKTKINFYFSIGKMYEDNNEPQKAKPYYEKVAAAVPDYYVVHRALGYLYLEDVKMFEGELDASQDDKTMKAQLTTAYYNAIKKALPQLEKAQACDPSTETLDIIKSLYKKSNDKKELNTLNKRLKELSKNCIDILTD
jgi:hypothetical protein